VVKARTVANGLVQRNWMSKEDITSPTALTESVLLTWLMDAVEGCFVATCNIPNAFVQTILEPKPGEPRTVMVLRGKLVDVLCSFDSKLYTPCIRMEKGQKVLYLIVNRAIYGMIESPMLWYQKLLKELKEYGFVVNPYDSCVVNKVVNGKYLTVVWHVDDLKCSHVEKQVVLDFIEWLRKKYDDKNGTVTVNDTKKHPYLGMVLDFSIPGSLIVDMREYVARMLKEYEEQVGKLDDNVICPWSDKLLSVNETSPRLTVDRQELFHTFVAKALFACKRARPDIQPAIAFLTTRVQKPRYQDLGKLQHLMSHWRNHDYGQRFNLLHESKAETQYPQFH